MATHAPQGNPSNAPAQQPQSAPDIAKLVKEGIDAGLKGTHEQISKLTSKVEALEGMLKGGKDKETSPEEKIHDQEKHAHGEHDKHDEHEKKTLNAQDDVFERVGKDAAARRPAALVGTAALGAGIGYGVAGLPLIENIPYLPAALAAMQQGVISLAQYIGLVTGSTSTNAILASIASPTVGMAAMGAVAVPGALWGLGKLKGLLEGREYNGLTRPIYEGLIWPVQWPLGLVKHTYNGLMRGRQGLSAGANSVAGSISKGWKNYAWPAVSPNRWALGGALLGGSVAAFAGAPVVLPAVAAGYFGGKFLRYMTGAGSSAASAPAAPGGHH